MTATASDAMMIFDRRQVRRQRNRAARAFGDHDFLVRDVAERVADRLDDLNRTFPVCLDLGAHTGPFAAIVGRRGGIRQVVACDLSDAMLRQAGQGNRLAARVVADEEALPFAAASLDLTVSILSLHWVNDLPGALIQIRRALRPDGVFIGAMFGGDTLREFRHCLAEAEMEVTGGLSPRASPFADVRDAGGLLQRAGFALPVVDSDIIEVSYPDAFALMRDLRGMGETNAVLARPKTFTRRSVLFRAAARLHEGFSGPDGRIIAKFQILYLTGWAPDPGQQKPLRPGSATARLAGALDAEETVVPTPSDRHRLSPSRGCE